ncbi:MAG TPA: GH116 family glycosyl hydrolase [Pyrinomonadaceae bacterium]|nr:GH116 family glycosyl hydrolase [Pyrinomonadaceae bacterium]
MKKIALFSLVIFVFGVLILNVSAQTPMKFIEKKELPKSRLELSRRTQNGSFYDVIGRKSAAFGYEHRNMEAWVYPIKILDDFALDFQIEGYNLPFNGKDILTNIEVRPEVTIFTYSHAAFRVRQIIYAPVDEQGLISLLDIKTTLPMTIGVSFRPKLRPMWAAGLMTPFVGQDEKEKYYFIGEESKKFFGIIGSPNAKDVSLMPYQEEPKDVPVRYTLDISPAEAEKNFVPIVMAGSVDGQAKAVETYKKLLANALPLYEQNVKYYEDFLSKTTQVTTPDERLNTAFAWAKIGTEKGVATNPYLGTGLLAGFRTSGDSERPGFAWYFGRDSMWTALAINSYGDFSTSKQAIDFLKKVQRDDGKIPHEISQSATLLDWWKGYPYPWNSTDATPLYIIVNKDLYEAGGDLEYLKANWDSILKAYKYEEATDTDGNGLIENTKFGHGWVEGGALYPPHEEIYLQGVWIEASRSLARMAEVLGDSATAERAKANAEKCRLAMEKTYWLDDKGFYAYATQIPRKEPVKAEPGPNLERRQKRLNELQNAKIYDEDTVLPAVPMWWRTMDNEKAQKQIDHLGSAKISTDWGSRILVNDSQLYDPLSYHYGSVWGLFTGWQSVAAYNYGRPQVGYQALMANSLLTYSNALGYVTELLSGDFNAPFGRSSHHQVWSEAMVVSPVLRGMFGIEVSNAGKTVKFAPQVPVNWNDYEAKSVRVGGNSLDFKVKREKGKMTVLVSQTGSGTKLILAPSFPLDAKIKSVTVAGKAATAQVKSNGDIQQAELQIDLTTPTTEIVYLLDEGTDVYWNVPNLQAGQENQGLRIIKSQAKTDGLSLVLEGRGGQTYQLSAKSAKVLKAVDGIKVGASENGEQQLQITFTGSSDSYIKREILLPFEPITNPKGTKK